MLNKKIFFYIYAGLFFLFLSAEANLISFNFGKFSQNFSTAELIILISFMFFFFIFKKENFISFFNDYKPFLIFSLLFIISGYLSALLSPADKIYAFKYFIRYFLFIFSSYSFIYFCFYYSDIKNDFYYFFFYFAIFFSIIAFFERYIPAFGNLLADIFREGKSVYINNILRPAATLSHSNILACFTTISIVIAIKLYFENKIKKLAFYTTIILFLSSLSICSSRNAFFVFIISCGFLLFTKKYKKTIFLIFLIFIMTYFIFSPSIKRISEIKTESSISRTLLWKADLKMFKEHIVFGVGPGCFNKLLPNYASEKLLKLENNFIKKQALNAHNGFFNVLAEFGLSGIIIVILFFIFYLRKFINLHSIFPITTVHSLLLAISLPFLLDAFFYSYFYMNVFLIIALALLKKAV